MLRTTLPGCDDGPYRLVLKALLPFEKEEKKRVLVQFSEIVFVVSNTIVSFAVISYMNIVFSLSHTHTHIH